MLSFYDELDAAGGDEITNVLQRYTTADYYWRGMHPFYEPHGAEAVANVFWKPFRQSFAPIQRRQDVFMAGLNQADNFESEWVCSMGHLLGLFDKDWLGIPSTGQPITMRYSDFWHIESGKLAENWVMVDNLGVIQQLADRDAEPRPPDRKQIYMTPANPISAQQNIGVFCSS